MLKVKRKTGHILVSAKCSSVVIILLVLCAPACALDVSGVPEWLKPAVTRSLNAVWSEIPAEPEIDREGTLALVASRLFAGYDVAVNAGAPEVIFTAHDEEITPEVKITVPELRGMALEWFRDDISGMSEDIAGLVEGLPQSALTWADEALREKIAETVSYMLPGWEFSQQIFISQNSTLINITFRPGMPLVLAVNPVLPSRTIPAVFRNDLQARMIPALSPLIGLPVKWVETHKNDIENFAREFLRERHAVANMRANLNVKFSAGTVSTLTARVDSENFAFSLWVAAYAGIEGRYPEIGTSFAFRPSVNLNPEIYAEIIFSLDNFDEKHRIGGRFEPLNNLWAGVEVQWPENEYFLRFQYSPVRIRGSYIWWRYSPELKEHEAAAGYHFDDHLAVELYYYKAGEDKIGLRGMWHL